MLKVDIKKEIQEAIKHFGQENLTKAGINLFKSLGYNVDRQASLGHPTYEDFNESFVNGNDNFNEVKALTADWLYVDLLFQISKSEITLQQELFDNSKVNNTVIESYLFFVIELKNDFYNRSTFSTITREINKLFPMPVMVLFKYDHQMTISIINRRLHKRDENKDVLEKVTLIKDISINNPHRAHIEILYDLSFEQLYQTHQFENFIELHNAWQKTLDTKELNKRFYKDLSNWYFWAMRQVRFPGGPVLSNLVSDPLKDPEVREHNAKNLIRLLTRILFVWFIKERDLIPEEFFDENYLKETLLNDFEPQKRSDIDYKIHGSKYYRAILQNLFFASLNQTMGKREFRKSGQHMNVTNLMRYKSYFKDPDKFLSLIENIVPFMNGGLFECLDYPDSTKKGRQGGDVINYLDGFSDRPDNSLMVPDYIFFGLEDHVDLSEDYGDKSKSYKDASVKGLINLLKSYKFTVTENTPIEEEVALDPELLGRVFENLLASYNPETKKTARKQTGSFYTPREIVNYIVDESLKAYLKQKLEDEAGMSAEDADVGLEFLIGYNEREHLFDPKQTEVLINAIDNCKILDPACGSGAFPMGVLHKMVHILHKLDPQNSKWKGRQIQKAEQIEDSVIREKLIEDIQESFENNLLDYGRKLYLIENCIYGVDVQPIAVQISKLRFFISLIVDQKTDKSKENFGIRPLPNLETKFVAANTLIDIKRPQGSIIDTQAVETLKKELLDIRHRIFSAKTPSTKRNLRDQDKALRDAIGELLVQYSWDSGTAYQIAHWDPYDQNTSSSFFDPEWMFGVVCFDIVIGNPPYIKEDTNRLAFKKIKSNQYYQGKMDIWYLFASLCIDYLKDNGILAFIATNNWVTNDGASKLRQKVNNECQILSIIDFNDFKVFTASIQTMIFVFRKSRYIESYRFRYTRANANNQSTEYLTELISTINDRRNDIISDLINVNHSDNNLMDLASDVICKILEKIENVSNFRLQSDNVFSGIDVLQDFVTKNHIPKLKQKNIKIGKGVFVLNDIEVQDLCLSKQEKIFLKPYYTPKELLKYYAIKENRYQILYLPSNMNELIVQYPNIKGHLDQFKEIMTSDNRPYGLHRCRDEKNFLGEKILSLRKCTEPRFTYCDFPCYVSRAFLIIKCPRIDMKYLTGVLNSKLVKFYLKYKGKMQGSQFQVDKNPLLKIPLINHCNRDEDKKEQIKHIVEMLVSLDHDHKIKESCKLMDQYEKEIDDLIYELYGITGSEKLIIEKNLSE